MSKTLVEVLAEHQRGDWSDHTFKCHGCSTRNQERIEAEAQALGRELTHDEKIAFRSEYNKMSHPGWSIDDYNAHVAEAVQEWIEKQKDE